MPRMAAPESTRLLVIYFCLQLVRVAFMMLPVFLILWPEAFSFLSRGRKSAGVSSAAQRSSLGSFLIVSGAGYLALRFVIRFFFAYALSRFVYWPRFRAPRVRPGVGDAGRRSLAGSCSLVRALGQGGGPGGLQLCCFADAASARSDPCRLALGPVRCGQGTPPHSKAPPTSADVVFALYRPTPSPRLVPTMNSTTARAKPLSIRNTRPKDRQTPRRAIAPNSENTRAPIACSASRRFPRLTI